VNRILVMGAAAMDTVARVQTFPQQDDIVSPLEIRRIPGGSAANVAVALSRLGAETVFLGTVGGDADGDAIIRAFADERVSCAHLLRLPQGRTAGAFIAVDENGERIMFSLGGDAVYTDVSQLDGIDFSADALYIAESFPAVGVEAARRVRAHGGRVFFAPGGVLCGYGLAEIAPLVQACDTMLLSTPELAKLTGSDDVRSGADALFSQGVPSLLVTQGARGAALCIPNGFVFSPPAPARVVDTTGAGDAFAAAYLFSELRGDAPKNRLSFANRCAAFAIERSGARTSPLLDEIERPQE
jgi:ribokinase